MLSNSVLSSTPSWPRPTAETSKVLVAVLDPDVLLRSGIRPPLRGAAAMAGGTLLFRHADVSITPVLVNGAAGILSRAPDGRLVSGRSFTVARGRIVESDALAIPRASVVLAWRSKDSASGP